MKTRLVIFILLTSVLILIVFVVLPIKFHYHSYWNTITNFILAAVIESWILRIILNK